jgi:hypothetical protein
MSMLLTLARRIARLFADTPVSGADPDAMSLHQWADLPPYHPITDRSGDGCAVLRP